MSIYVTDGALQAFDGAVLHQQIRNKLTHTHVYLY